jgi:hypothetical protein
MNLVAVAVFTVRSQGEVIFRAKRDVDWLPTDGEKAPASSK